MALIQLALNVFAVVLLAGASRAEVNCLPFQARVYLFNLDPQIIPPS